METILGLILLLILITLLLLGPIMTFFYACFGTRSRVLRISTLICFLLQFNARGALIARAPLSNPIPVGPYPSPLAQLVLAEDKLISLVYPSPEKPNSFVDTGCSLYLIDSRSGDCRPVRSPGAASHQVELGTARASTRITPAELQR